MWCWFIAKPVQASQDLLLNMGAKLGRVMLQTVFEVSRRSNGSNDH